MVKEGIALYNIELDGSLNGVYTNEIEDGVIFNEVIRKRPNTGEDALSGIYDSFYFDPNNQRVNSEVTISIVSGMERTYDFSWAVDKVIIFKGIGYKMNEKQVAVHYWQV